jgi:hypothetical protein
MPVTPPNVNKSTKPTAHAKEGDNLQCIAVRGVLIFLPCRDLIQLKILIPVGTAITIVAVVK